MKTKEWTLMFFFASDNPLASTVVSQLKAIKDAGYHPDANVIAHFDPHDPSTPVHVFDVNHANKFWHPNHSEVGFTSHDPFIRDLVLDRLWGEDKDQEPIRKMVIDHIKKKSRAEFDPPKPSAAMATEQSPREALASFLNFCRESYPARHYLLFILGHGQVVGTDTLLFDDHAEKKSLSLAELGTVLRSFNADVHNDRVPAALEMITLHSCSMSAMEVAYELKGAANYLLASQGPTYVGNLPYKQILMRIFNHLNDQDARLQPEDINGSHAGTDGKQSLVEKLVNASEPVSQFVRDKLTHPTIKALDKYDSGSPPHSNLMSLIVKDVNNLLEDEDTGDKLRELMSSNGKPQSNGHKQIETEKRRINRLLLADAFPEISRYPKHSIKNMFSEMFYYCIYNSYDFQLAGYPYDLCLTNLTKVSDTEDPLNELADSLIQGLQSKNPIPKQLILLAHWDAQSFYQEDYVDLYDFCFCLTNRIKEMESGTSRFPSLRDIRRACKNMMDALEKGCEKMIIHQAFSGAAFQYSHGQSIYFPWTKPRDSKLWDEQYGEYRLNRRTRWRDFLNVYFEQTRRKTRGDELKAVGREVRVEDPVIEDLLTLVGQIGAHVFPGEGAREKPGPDHPMGKYGPDDPFGGGCNCPMIKNYPASINLSKDFFAGVDIIRNASNSS